MQVRNKLFLTLNMIVVALSIYVAFLIIVIPAPKERYSTLFLLNDEHIMGEFPKELPPGYDYPIWIGVINNEKERANYSIYFKQESKGLSRTEKIHDFVLDDNQSLILPHALRIRNGQNLFIIDLVSNNAPRQNRLWVNSTNFYILNSTGGIKDIPLAVPYGYKLPINLFVFNDEEENRSYAIGYKHSKLFFDTRFDEKAEEKLEDAKSKSGEAPFTDFFELELEKNETGIIPLELDVSGWGGNLFVFRLFEENITRELVVNGKIFYVINETKGLKIQGTAPINSNITVNVGVAYVYYKPEYQDVNFTVSYRYEDEEEYIGSYNFILKHEIIKEFPVQLQVAKPGENTFLFELYDTGRLLRIERVSILGVGDTF